LKGLTEEEKASLKMTQIMGERAQIKMRIGYTCDTTSIFND